MAKKTMRELPQMLRRSQTVKEVKAQTVYLRPDQIAAIARVQAQHREENGTRLTISDFIQQAVDLKLKEVQ